MVPMAAQRWKLHNHFDWNDKLFMPRHNLIEVWNSESIRLLHIFGICKMERMKELYMNRISRQDYDMPCHVMHIMCLLGVKCYLYWHGDECIAEIHIHLGHVQHETVLHIGIYTKSLHSIHSIQMPIAFIFLLFSSIFHLFNFRWVGICRTSICVSHTHTYIAFSVRLHFSKRNET